MTSNKPKEGFIKSKGFKLHYLRWGEKGFPLVILHGMTMNAHAYDSFSKAVSGEYQVLAFDLLDHGDSEKLTRPVGFNEHAKTIWYAIKQLGFSSGVIVGHSLGGIIGMILAAKHPDDLKGLVIVDIAPFDLGDGRVAPPRHPPECFADENEAREFLLKEFPKFTREEIDYRLKNMLAKRLDDKLRLKGAMLQSQLLDWWSCIKRIKIPTLLLIAGDSGIVTPKALDKMSSFIDDLKTITVKGASHMLPQDKPVEFEREVRSFLACLLLGS